MKRLCFCFILGIWSLSTISGQLLTVGNQKVSEEEFVRMYEKNTPNPNFRENSLREYMNRLILYKLKVQAALDQDVDKAPEVQRDLKSYAEQLAQPYLTDQDLLEKMLQEVYDHSLQDAHARQITVRCSPFANPVDTLLAYKEAMRIRERLIKGENFDSIVANENTTSGKQITSSDMRYFSAFVYPYSIENFAFSAKIGDYSMPLRSEIGYHIVQLLDRQMALGKINASQIFLHVSDSANEQTVKLKADSLYYLITSGKRSFEDIARQYSDDKISGLKGGRMSEFNVTRVEPQFMKQLYTMPIEVVSHPFRAENGYHIVILHDVSGIADYESLRNELLYRFQNSPRAELVRQSFVNSLAKTYPIVEINGALERFASKLDSSLIDGWWEYEPDEAADSIISKVGTLAITNRDFGRYIENVQMDYHSEAELFMTFIQRNYKRYIGDLLIRCESENVGRKYEQFNKDFNEYREGVLAFEITNRNVWAKSSSDTNGLYDYYDSQKHCFMWPARIQALIFKYDVRQINTDDVQKFLTSSYKKRHSAEQIIDQANKHFDPKYISVTINVYEPGQNKFTDRIDWTQLGLSKDIAAGGYEKGFVYIYHYYPSTCKSLEDIRGIMVEQYQAYLEQEWLKNLSAKYSVNVNEEKLEHLIKK